MVRVGCSVVHLVRLPKLGRVSMFDFDITGTVSVTLTVTGSFRTERVVFGIVSVRGRLLKAMA